MEVSQAVALRGPDGLGPHIRCRPLDGLAFERCASLPGPRRGVARKRGERLRSGIRHARRGSLFFGDSGEEPQMAAVMIGVDPHKASHTAAAIGPDEQPLGQVRMPASVSQAEQLVAWAAGWPERTWAVEGATGLGNLLAQQLVAAGEQVVDVLPKVAAR